MSQPVTAIFAVYGSDALQWVGGCLESLHEAGEVTSMVVVTDTVRPEWIAWANARGVSLAAVKIGATAQAERFRQFQTDPALTRSTRLVAWHAALHLLAQGSRFVALEVDTLVRKPLEKLFDEATPIYSALAVPRALKPTGRYFYQLTAIAGQAVPMVERFLDDYLRELQRLLSQQQTLRELYGSLESAAWQSLVQRADETSGVILGALPVPCTTLMHLAGRQPEFSDVDSVAADWFTAKKRSGL